MKKCVVLVVSFVLLLTLVACGGNRGSVEEEFEWGDMVLSDILPAPKSNTGNIYSNRDDFLSIDIHKISKDDYEAYLEACQSAGFTVESDSAEDYYSTYNAFNEAGYKLSLRYGNDSEELHIELNAPIEMGTLQWPASEMISLLPVPKSSVGNIDSETSTFFHVYVGETSIEDYNAYIDECMEEGFSLDYSRGDTDFFADNAEGYHLSVSHEGNEVMSIVVQKPEDTSDTGDVSVSESEEASPNTPSSSSPSPVTPSTDTPVSATGTAGWREFLADYEEFVDDYLAFMERYQANPTDLSLLTDYAEMMEDLSEWSNTADDFESELNDPAELAEFTEEYLRILAKITTSLAG